MSESIESRWVIEYVNGHQFVSRYADHWALTRELSAATLFRSGHEADKARSALWQEADDRLARSKEHLPAQIWWDVRGGLLAIQEVEIVTRLKPATTTLPQSVNAVAGAD